VGKPGLRKVHRYSVEFKLTAVKLSGMPGVQVQTVAAALDTHPFMLSRWRKEARDGVLKGATSAGGGRPPAWNQATPGAGARARRIAGTGDATQGMSTPKVRRVDFGDCGPPQP
jgi:transposase-like protein